MSNKMKLNKVMKGKQQLALAVVVAGFFTLWIFIMLAARHSTHDEKVKSASFTGVMDSQFSEADTESAMTTQQIELDTLKTQMKELTDGIKSIKESNQAQTNLLAAQISSEIAQVKTEVEKKPVTRSTEENTVLAQNDMFFPGNNEVLDVNDRFKPVNHSSMLNKSGVIHSAAFNYDKPKKRYSKSPHNYVPSNTFAKAIILGGADSDASVNAQNKDNGVMLLKILSPGTLPNGQHSYLSGCFLSVSSYGDISTERAFAKLEKISCSPKGHTIIDKVVTGWVFFGGKAGIKGKPIMRDGKIIQWAGISGALAGVAQAAQYAQTVQNFGGYGIASAVPSNKIAPYVGYGGASKAAEQLSNYYIKRAEQYHPAIQVGAGNLVNVVFKDGFYLNDDEEDEKQQYSKNQSEPKEPTVPPEVLAQLNGMQLGQTINSAGGVR